MRNYSYLLVIVYLMGFAQGLAAAGVSLPGGLYENPMLLRFTNVPQGQAVRFTRDGSIPTAFQGELSSGSLTLTRTTVLRFASFQDSHRIGPVMSQSYIFPKDILQQSGNDFPITWGSKEGRAIPADYEMDPEILAAPEYRAEAVKSLHALPALSLVMDGNALFGSDLGIYSHPEQTGKEWERPCSIELIEAGKTRFQGDCGVRIQGGWNRRPEESPKHSFRLVFKKKYGPGKFRYPLFGAEREFDSLILRSGCNNSWLHWNGAERQRGDLIRDQWMRDSLREMGHFSASGFFVHLFLNGLYWGIYNLAERPDASFASQQFGGEPENYDSFNAEKLLSGNRDAWTTLMKRINNGVKNSEDLQAVSDLLDLTNFADYMILNFYGANADWDRHSNWYACRRRNPSGRFHFFVWDAERSLENPNDDTIDFDDDQSPPRIFHRLIENEGFRELFSKRVQLHLTSGGALTPLKCSERYQKWAERLDLAIIAESARWGDYRRDLHQYKEGPYELYTRDTHWRPEVQRLLKHYFPARTENTLKLFRARGFLHPNTADSK